MKLWLYLKYFVFLNFCKVYNAIQLFRLKFKGCHFNQVRAINSMFENSDDAVYIALITNYLKDMIKYSDADSPDYIKDPEHTLFTWIGNCNDTSRTLCRLINQFRPWLHSNLMIVYAKNYRGHCVCYVEMKDSMIHCSNWGLYKNFESREDVAKSIHPNWTYYAIIDHNLNIKEIKLNS